MELFIRIKDGQPFEHPIFGSNFRQAFPDVDTNNLPPEFARFERVPAPSLTPYQHNQRVKYTLFPDGVCRDVWECDNMTAAEVTAKQEQIKTEWSENGGYASWVFNPGTCSFEAPVSMPNDGSQYVWDEPTLSWVLAESVEGSAE